MTRSYPPVGAVCLADGEAFPGERILIQGLTEQPKLAGLVRAVQAASALQSSASKKPAAAAPGESAQPAQPPPLGRDVLLQLKQDHARRTQPAAGAAVHAEPPAAPESSKEDAAEAAELRAKIAQAKRDRDELLELKAERVRRESVEADLGRLRARNEAKRAEIQAARSAIQTSIEQRKAQAEARQRSSGVTSRGFVVSQHPDALYTGLYRRFATWNGRPAYRNQHGRFFYFYMAAGEESQFELRRIRSNEFGAGWTFDDRDQSGCRKIVILSRFARCPCR